jgi:hypothetical protein
LPLAIEEAHAKSMLQLGESRKYRLHIYGPTRAVCQQLAQASASTGAERRRLF